MGDDEIATADTDPVLKAAAALFADGVAIEPEGEELEHWRMGDFIRSDIEVLRLAESRGLIAL